MSLSNKFCYGVTEDKYVSPEKIDVGKRKTPLDSFKFRIPEVLRGKPNIPLKEVPLRFRETPDDLIELASAVVNKESIPNQFSWDNLRIRHWIKDLGFPQYMQTFRRNRINGRTLLLLDANRLVKMNIQNFDHIKTITNAIRKMYDVPDMYNYVPDMYYGIHLWQTHYKLYRVKNGLKYQRTRRTDLWRRLRLLRKKREYLIHWQILERWLQHKLPDEWERVGLIHRYNLYHTKKYPPPPVLPWYLKPIKIDLTSCNCMTPCACDWDLNRKEFRVRLSVLGGKLYKTSKEMGDAIDIEDHCRFKTVLQVLSYHLPNKYRQTVDELSLKMPRKDMSAQTIPPFQWNQHRSSFYNKCKSF
ncbi:SAMD15 family protein [Megaselia abdita]